MSNDLEFNKIFAAILVAGVVAGLTGFVAKKIVHPEMLHEDAVPIEGVAADAGSGAAAEATAEPILALLATANVEAGAKVAKKCAACHSFDASNTNMTGPSLHNIVGRAKGHMSGFAYSDGMMAMGTNWSYENLNKFLWKPKAYVAGTKMNFVGLKDPQERADLIAWLRTQDDSPEPLPTEAEIAAEAPKDAAAATPAEGAPVDAKPAAAPAATPAP
jgi:cytochrome c